LTIKMKPHKIQSLVSKSRRPILPWTALFEVAKRHPARTARSTLALTHTATVLFMEALMVKNALLGRRDKNLTLDALRAEHEALDTRLGKLDRQRSLSPEEQYEMMVIKKRKLALKDQISRLTAS
jgi:uncharacterized protein YdcH (DUF465 family)